MKQGDLVTVDWRLAFEMFERWQAVPPCDRPAMLARLCAERPELAGAMQSLVRADAVATRDPVGVSLQLLAGERSGTTVGVWRLERLLGSGGMGEVWLANRSDALHQGQAAIKLLQAHQRSPAAHARFAAEARLLARLAHPHIARLLDVGIDASGQRHLVLEYVAGEPVDRWCDAHDASVAERLRLFLQVCDAVAHAHAQLVVHRDLKPSNILVDADRQAKLLDFGIAKLLDDSEEGLTRTGLVVLTPEYAAPEQLTGEPVTVATDVYALGVLLFELLSGERPYLWAKSSPLEQLRVVLETEPRVLSRTAPAARAAQLRGDLDHIVARALQRAPRDRYASVRALAADVQRHLDHEPVQATAPTWRYRAGKFVRRHRTVVAAGTVVVLTLLGGTATALWQAARAQAAASEALAEAAKANATREFLLGLFRSVKVGEADLRASLERPVRELLFEGGQRLLADRTLAPAVRLDLMTTLGALHAGLSLLEGAERLEGEALVLARQIHGADSDIAVRTMIALGGTFNQLARPREGIPMLFEALAIIERTGRQGSESYPLALHDLGEALMDDNDARAAGYLVRAVQAYDTAFPEHAERVSAHVALLRTHLLAERFAEADREAEHTEAVILSKRGQRPYDRFDLDTWMGVRWEMVGNLERASTAWQRAVMTGDQSIGPRHPQTVSVRVRLAGVEHQRGNRAHAHALLDEVRAAPRDQAVWSQDRFDRTLAGMLYSEGDAASALEVAARLLQKDDAGEHQRANDHIRFARSASLAGRYGEALASARLGLDMQIKAVGPSSLAHWRAQAVLAEALQRAGQLPAAAEAFESLLSAVEAHRSQSLPVLDTLRVRALNGLSAHHLPSDPAAALRMAGDAVSTLGPGRQLLDERVLRAEAWLAQARALRALGERDKARRIAREALAQLERDQVRASPRLAAARIEWIALKDAR